MPQCLVRRGLATYTNGIYLITPAGSDLVTAGRGVMQSLAQQGFPKSQLSQAQKRNFDDIVMKGKYDSDQRMAGHHQLMARPRCRTQQIELELRQRIVVGIGRPLTRAPTPSG
jgi:hypothetical protein